MKSLLPILSMAIVMVLTGGCAKEYSAAALNQPPVSVAGPDRISIPNEIIILDGSASYDPDGTIQLFKWFQLSGPTALQISSVAQPITSVKNVSPGIYQVVLMVTDNLGLASKDTVQILSSGNKPPVAVAGSDKFIYLPLDSVNLDGSFSYDTDGFIQQYSWLQLSGPTTIVLPGPAMPQTPCKFSQAGIYKVELKVTDNSGLTAKDTVQITVLANQPPPAVNVFFYFTDQTSSLGNNISVIPYSPNLDLVTVKIPNYPDGKILGVWGQNYGPVCPVLLDYNSDPELYTSYYLLPGTYNWTAEISGVNLTPYPIFGGTAFSVFMASPHTVTGTLTIPPNTSCLTVKIMF
jgi:hypothetical protein